MQEPEVSVEDPEVLVEHPTYPWRNHSTCGGASSAKGTEPSLLHKNRDRLPEAAARLDVRQRKRVPPPVVNQTTCGEANELAQNQLLAGAPACWWSQRTCAGTRVRVEEPCGETQRACGGAHSSCGGTNACVEESRHLWRGGRGDSFLRFARTESALLKRQPDLCVSTENGAFSVSQDGSGSLRLSRAKLSVAEPTYVCMNQLLAGGGGRAACLCGIKYMCRCQRTRGETQRVSGGAPSSCGGPMFLWRNHSTCGERAKSRSTRTETAS